MAQVAICNKIGSSIHCNDYERHGAREKLEKLDKNSWEYRRGVEKLDSERKERIDTEIQRIQSNDIRVQQDKIQRKADKKRLDKMLGKNAPVKVDADGFYQ